MLREPDVLVLDTVATLFDDTTARELQAAIEAQLPDLDIALAETAAESVALIESTPVALTALPAPEAFEAATDLRWVQATNAGVDAYDLDFFRDERVALTNASGVAAEPIAEQVLGYLLAFERRFDRAIRQQRARHWERYRAGELRGKTVGIVGVGAIGSRIADLASALGTEVLGTKRDLDSVPETVDRAWTPDGLGQLLDASDYLVLACPLTETTRGLIGTDELDRLASSSVLVNIARGPVVEEPALIEALETDSIRGAALDVVTDEPLSGDSPLWDLDNVFLTPHMAGYTPHYMDRCADLFTANYGSFIDGDVNTMSNKIV
jgi:phosphoglycerate dehydrogenase-like enzyme